MEQYNLGNGRQEAGLAGVGSIQNGGEDNYEAAFAAAAGGGPGPSGVSAGAGGGPSGVAAAVFAAGDPSQVAAGDGPSQYATAVAAAGGQGRYVPLGPISGLAAGGSGGDDAAGVPSGVDAASGGLISGVAAVVGAGLDQSGFAAGGGTNGYAAVVAAAGVPRGVAGGGAGPSSESARGNRRRNHRHSEQQINAMEAHFKDDPQPSKSQRGRLARRIGLEPAQVKFWFQNKRTQVKSQIESEENDALRSENDVLQAQKQQLIEALKKKTCMQCCVGGSQQTIRNNMILQNSHLRKEVESLKSTIVGCKEGQNLQNLPITFQEPRNPSTVSKNQENLAMTLHDPPNLSIPFENPQNLPIIPLQNPLILPMLSQNLQNLPLISEIDNATSYPVDMGLGYESTSITSSGEGIRSINVPTSHEFKQSLFELVISAAEELKVKSMYMDPLWISSSVDGATSMLDEVEYLSLFPSNFGPVGLGYTCEATRHVGRVLMSPAHLLDILMNVDEWAFTFSDIVSKALTLDVVTEGVNHNAALLVMAAEYHIPTPQVPNRGTYFARYCTQHCEGVWAVVDVSLDKILPTPQNMSCQKRPSGCLIQGMSDGSSKITWIEHVYVDYTGVSTIYRRLLRSGLGFGAKRWFSIVERQSERIMLANVPSTSHDLNNMSMLLSPEGRKGILMFALRMLNSFIFGITGIRTDRWTELNGNFGDDIRLMCTRVVDEPGLPSGTLLSASTSFALSLTPHTVFNFFHDYNYRKEWDILAAEGNISYEPVCRISNGEEASNCVSIYKVIRRQGDMLELQESWSNPVASHIVFSSTEIRTIDAILGGGDPNGLPLLPFGFTILPDGPSSPIDGSSGTLLTMSIQVLISKSPTADIDFEAAFKVTDFLRCHCQKIKHALGAVGPNTRT